MSQPTFFADEDVYAAVTVGLRKAGLDAISTPEAHRLGESDESQLAFAASAGRVLLTFNVAHFAALHAGWVSKGAHHAGIVVSAQRPIGDIWPALLTPTLSTTGWNSWATGKRLPNMEFVAPGPLASRQKPTAICVARKTIDGMPILGDHVEKLTEGVHRIINGYE